MLHRSLLAAAGVAALMTPALAADMTPPMPTGACAPPQSYIAAAAVPTTFRAWSRRGDRPRMLYVERYDPRNPPPAPTPAIKPGPTYIAPQTAYLASPICDFAYGQPRRSWYDGQLFYWPGGVKAGPDSFMIIER